MINTYYQRLKHLRMAQPYINDINLLRNAYTYSDKYSAISVVSFISVKYESELQKIAFYVSSRPITRGNIYELYNDYTMEDYFDDIDYLTKCIIIIAIVRLRIKPSLESALEELFSDDEYF